MSILTSNLVLDLVAILATLLIGVIAYLKWNLSYWEKRGVQTLNPEVFFGDGRNFILGKCTIGEQFKTYYKAFKSKGLKHGGVFLGPKPFYVPTDPEIVKHIMQKDFQYFMNHGNYINEENDPLSGHLFNLEDTKWKNMRVKLTPTFTSGKMKMMFQTLVDCTTGLKDIMNKSVVNQTPVDIKDILGRFTTDIIGSCAFGLEFNTFKDDDSPFRKYGKKVFTSTPVRQFLTSFSNSFPSLANNLGVRVMPRDVSGFFSKVVKDTVEYREKNNYTRKDFMQLLIDLKNNKLSEDGYKHDGNTLTTDEITAQSFIFFLAGFETSSTTMTFALYELAKHQDIQKKVRDEINKVLGKYDGKVTYEAIQDMHYMNQVLDETLRKYPPVPFVTRQCVKQYKIPDQDIIIEKGIKVVIPILGIHHDEEYFPDPEKFDPDRFNEENSKNRHPYAHIPFGEGPRICIGLRFGMMQSKVGLTSLLRKYNFTLNNKTIEPMKFNPRSFVLAADGDIWLDAQKVE